MRINCTECGRNVDEELLSGSAASLDVGAITCADHEDPEEFGEESI